MKVTKETKLFVKAGILPGRNMASGKFYAETGGALWDVTEEVFDLYCKDHPQCNFYRGRVTSVHLSKIPAISLENVN